MSTPSTMRTAPLAAALLIGIGLLAGCNRHNDENADTTVPPAATAMPPAASTAGMPADMGMPPASTTSAMPASSTMANPMGSTMGTTRPITDTSFYQQALSAGDKEIAAAKLAEKNGSDKAVKDYAKMLVTDHTAMGKKVKDAAGTSVTEPTTPPDTSALDGKTGKDFDKAFVDQMVTDHQNAVALFDNASKNASTDKAKSLASDALPKLQKHLDEAQKLQASMQ